MENLSETRAGRSIELVVIGTIRSPLRELKNMAGQSRGAKAAVGEVVVDGIGAGALAELKQAGFKVFQAQPGTVADNLERVARKELAELTANQVTAGTAQPHGDDDNDLPRFGCGF